MIYHKTYATHQFELIKTCTYSTESLAIKYEENLKRLHEDVFTGIRIPNFSYKRKNNVIVCHMEFIKGDQLHNFSKNKYSKLVYESIVLRMDSFGNPYSFKDYSPSNFVVCKATNDLYFIDLECYQKISVDDRMDLFFGKYQWKSYK